GRGAVRNLLRERGARLGRAHARPGNDRDGREREPLGNAGDPSLPSQADAAGEGGGEVVRVALERHAACEQLLGAERLARDRACRGEAERDDRRARAEPALARDPARELEAEPARVAEQPEGADAEMAGVGVAAFAHDALVPEVERGRRAVEPGPEIPRGGRRAHAHRKHAAGPPAIASASGSTSTTGAAMRSTASGSFSPWPVTMTTTVPAAPSR